jgi:hypothetical protein
MTMKRILNIILSITVVSFFACSFGDHKRAHDGDHDHGTEAAHMHDDGHEGAVKPTSSTGNFGEVITAENALPASQLPALLEGKETMEVKLTGKVESVCQMSGCWMDVRMGEGEIVHVTFKEDGFLLPKDAAGKTTVIEGVATYEEIPVKMLRHLAEDEGKSQEEIDAITEPKMEYTLVAKGVILQ